jgi:hypothetical protein
MPELLGGHLGVPSLRKGGFPLDLGLAEPSLCRLGVMPRRLYVAPQLLGSCFCPVCPLIGYVGSVLRPFTPRSGISELRHGAVGEGQGGCSTLVGLVSSPVRAIHLLPERRHSVLKHSDGIGM